ncbi:isocitrate lyase/PEP mutase family protein [Sinorhizobium meliloti]|uniref:isocitrate lyase/PEP mutase family protein n=1 Tax=Rhizobium meliloti TaxID=382 RepID=UPI001296D122|nr:isocitrate lyase/PEP mutase family protein [Sinorhizobium meliloti]MQU72447.1 carboxyvinyl-carboxyphosphonate phosphorylmutase [Sinorhizobium meliloti]
MRLRESVTTEKPSAFFRRSLNEGIFPLAGVWGATAHHAQLAEAAGFTHFGISGSSSSMHLLGLPDAGLITATEIIENARRICQAVSIPVIVDCDTGFGNAMNVIRTVDAVIRTGAASMFIEDQVSPKRCGFVKGKELIPLDEAVGKFRAACDVRDQMDRDFVVQARTDARGAVGGGMDEVLRRGEAYLNAGVDVLYVEALQSREEIRTLREAFPEAWLKVTTQALQPPLSTKEFEEFRLCTVGVHITTAGAIAMFDHLRDYRERGIDAQNDHVARFRGHPLAGFGTFDLVGFPKISELESRYLSEDTLNRYEQSMGLYDPRDRAQASR